MNASLPLGHLKSRQIAERWTHGHGPQGDGGIADQNRFGGAKGQPAIRLYAQNAVRREAQPATQGLSGRCDRDYWNVARDHDIVRSITGG